MLFNSIYNHVTVTWLKIKSTIFLFYQLSGSAEWCSAAQHGMAPAQTWQLCRWIAIREEQWQQSQITLPWRRHHVARLVQAVIQDSVSGFAAWINMGTCLKAMTCFTVTEEPATFIRQWSQAVATTRVKQHQQEPEKVSHPLWPHPSLSPTLVMVVHPAMLLPPPPSLTNHASTAINHTNLQSFFTYTYAPI